MSTSPIRYQRTSDQSCWEIAGTPLQVVRDGRHWRVGLSARVRTLSDDRRFWQAEVWWRASGLAGRDVRFASRDEASRAALAQLAASPFPFTLKPLPDLVAHGSGRYLSSDGQWLVHRRGEGGWWVAHTFRSFRAVAAVTLDHARRIIDSVPGDS